LLALVDGAPMARRSLDVILASHVRPVIVVTGHDRAALERALAAPDVIFHHAAEFADGMSASLKAGIAALPSEAGAALICLADMPFTRPETLDRLAEAFAAKGRLALFPSHGGQRGNPVLLGRGLFPAVAELTGDQGARALLAAIPDRVGEVAVDDPGVLRDLDHPGALAR
jgi:molybdenum cofactor cytidylyltransferase